jgi:hypothetical protein
MHIEEQVDKLQSEIDRKRQEIRSDHCSMSIGELINLHVIELNERVRYQILCFIQYYILFPIGKNSLK